MRIYYRSATGQVEPFFERANRWQLHESPQCSGPNSHRRKCRLLAELTSKTARPHRKWSFLYTPLPQCRQRRPSLCLNPAQPSSAATCRGLKANQTAHIPRQTALRPSCPSRRMHRSGSAKPYDQSAATSAEILGFPFSSFIVSSLSCHFLRRHWHDFPGFYDANCAQTYDNNSARNIKATWGHRTGPSPPGPAHQPG